jgi:soluble lytic murein transglycosylase-like protein
VKALTAGVAALTAAALAVLTLGAASLAAVAAVIRHPASPPARAAAAPASLLALYQAAAADQCPPLPWTLLAAQGKVESGYRADARSPVGAVGIAQFMPGTWASWGVDGDHDGTADPFNPADAIPAQARYDCALLRAVSALPGDPIALMLAAYNAGLGAVRRYHGVPPYRETRAYITAVLTTARALNAAPTPKEIP